MNEIEIYNLIKQAHIEGHRAGYATANNFNIISNNISKNTTYFRLLSETKLPKPIKEE